MAKQKQGGSSDVQVTCRSKHALEQVQESRTCEKARDVMFPKYRF